MPRVTKSGVSVHNPGLKEKPPSVTGEGHRIGVDAAVDGARKLGSEARHVGNDARHIGHRVAKFIGGIG
jgi:hypothetical protein